MVREAPLQQTENGLVPAGDGWFVLNARDARWKHAPGRGASLAFDGWPDGYFPQVGVNLFVLGPGEPLGMYHWEAEQEDFLVLAGEALLIVEGEERPLRQWDFFHCPPGTGHIVLGAGAGPCAVLAIGTRENQDTPQWGAYTVEERAVVLGAGVEVETTEAAEAYARVPERKPTRYRDGWLP